MRYRSEDEIRLQKTVDAFNRKVRRLEKQGMTAPERVSRAAFRKDVTETRQDFNREIKRLERFMRKGEEKAVTFSGSGVTLTKWEIKELNRQIAINNRKREKIKTEIMSTPLVQRGKPVTGPDGTQLVRAQMGGPQENAMNPKKVNLEKTQSKAAFRKLQESVFKEAKKKTFEKRNSQWKDNYIKALHKEYDPVFVAHITDRINKMSEKKFAYIMRSDQDAEIGFEYGVMEKRLKLETLTSIWTPELSTENLSPKK